MPVNARGQQLITFSIEQDEDQDIGGWYYLPIRKGETVARLAARFGHPEDAQRVAKENGIRSTNSPFTGKGRSKVKVPGAWRASLSFSVMAGNSPPTITDGYAKITTVARPERVGLTVFEGYNPVTMTVPIRFEARDFRGLAVEVAISLLERMAGRGNFGGAAVGPPPVIRLSTTNGRQVVPLIPRNYQWSEQNKTGPLWRISDIDWDEQVGTGVLRNDAGNRIRQLAVVTVQQHTRLSLVSRSVTVRAATKPKPRKPPVKKRARR